MFFACRDSLPPRSQGSDPVLPINISSSSQENDSPSTTPCSDGHLDVPVSPSSTGSLSASVPATMAADLTDWLDRHNPLGLPSHQP